MTAGTTPTLTEVIRSALEAFRRSLHTALPGRIVSYDSARQVADVEIQIELALPKRDGTTTHEQLPKLRDVPIGHPAGGGYFVHLPLAPGDFVWVMFSECSLEAFIGDGKIHRQKDLRTHGLSGAYAIPALSPAEPNKLGAQPSGKLVLRREDGPAIAIDEDYVHLGDVSADDAVALAGKVHSAISTMLGTGVGATGSEAFAAAKIAWDAAVLTPAGSVAASKVKAT